jgi:hypothetical protein
MAQGLVLPFLRRQGVSPTGMVVGRLEVNVPALIHLSGTARAAEAGFHDMIAAMDGCAIGIPPPLGRRSRPWSYVIYATSSLSRKR